MRSNTDAPGGFGTLMQHFIAKDYIGDRVRLTAAIRSANVTEFAAVCMRVDRHGAFAEAHGGSIAFDNMADRTMQGTTDSQRYEIVLDVSETATGPGSQD